jgi:two-component system chemotaxis response regulator CheB
VVLAASAGGIRALGRLLAALPQDLPAAILIVQHRTPTKRSHLEQILGRQSRIPVTSAVEGEPVRGGVIYLARPDLHLTISADKRFVYSDGTRIRHVRSSANPLLESAAAAFDGRVIAVVLTGGGSDGTDGVQSVKAHGGTVIAEDPTTAEHFAMPQAAVRSGAVDYVLPLAAIGPAIDAITRGVPLGASMGGPLPQK